MNGYKDSRRSYLSLKTAIRTSLLLVSAAALAACGGGGGGGGGNNNPPAQQPPPTSNPPPPPPTNNPPTAEAGDNKTTNFPEPVSLTGSGSDPEGAALTYAWTATPASGTTGTVEFAAASAAATTAKFSAPGTYTLTLTVNDGTTSVADTATVVVNTPLYPTTEWVAAEPATVGMNTTLLDEARTYATSKPMQIPGQAAGVTDEGGSGVIVRYGKAVYSWGSQTFRYDLKSTSKSIGGIALLLALDDDFIALDDLAAAEWPGLLTSPTTTDPTWPAQITVGQLASHTAGYDKTDANRNSSPGNDGNLSTAPGAQWRYSDAGLNSLADVLTTSFNQDLHTVLQSRVFSKIGVTSGAATGDGQFGTTQDLYWRWSAMREPTLGTTPRRELASGIRADVDAMARIGYLFLRNGQWGTEALISPESIGLVTEQHSGSATNPDEVNFPQAVANYGLLWWTNKTGQLEGVPTDAYWAWGLGDSLIVVIPSLDLVIARAGVADETNVQPRSWNNEWNGDYDVLADFVGKIAQATTP